nr:hepatoma-derived growth factor-related protein 2-like [Leptinotarsa decemlineata]
MATHTQNLDESLPNLSQTVVSNILEMEETYSKNMGSPHSSINQNSSVNDLERRKRKKKRESEEKIMKKAKKSEKSSLKSPSRRRNKMKHEKRDKDKPIKVREMEVIAGPSISLQQVPEYEDVSPGSTPPPTIDLEK